MEMKLKFRRKSAIVASYAEASQLFRDWRGNMGSLQCPNAELYDATGKQIAYVSYNGKVWPGTAYKANAVALYDPHSDIIAVMKWEADVGHGIKVAWRERGEYLINYRKIFGGYEWRKQLVMASGPGRKITENQARGLLKC